MAREKKRSEGVFAPRFRIYCGDEVALGPGKVQLLRAVRETGSIRQAALQLEMSYMRAWLLVRTMNRCFKEPLVTTDRGGSRHGGAELTETGLAALDAYERLEAESLAAIKPMRDDLEKLLLRRPRRD